MYQYIETGGVAALIAVGAWVSQRLVRRLDSLHAKVDDDIVPRLVRVETKVENGGFGVVYEVKAQVDKIHTELRDHAEGEEERIVSAYRRLQEEDSARQARGR